MNRTFSWIFAAATLVSVLSCTALWAQSNQPSLADVARRKPARKAKIVVTNDDIPPAPMANQPAASVLNSPGSAADAGSTPEPRNKAAVKLQLPSKKETKLQELLAERSNLESVIKHLEKAMAERTDEHAKETLNGALQHAKQNLAEKQQQIEELQKAEAAAPASPQGGEPVKPPAPPPN